MTATTPTDSPPDVIESTSIELEPVTDRTLFRTSDPVEVLEAAKRVAGALKAELDAAGMVLQISGREHVRVEGWATLGAMVGVTTSIVWSRPVENGWEARAEVRTLDGRLVGAGEAMCTRDERNWARRDAYALRSMAQTRAASKALRIPLAFVMTLSGYSGTPAEEVPESEPAPVVELPGWAKPADTETIMRASRALVAIFRALGSAKPSEPTVAFGKKIRERFGGSVPVGVAFMLEDLVAAALKPQEADETTAAS
jgi:hypothetical protein